MAAAVGVCRVVLYYRELGGITALLEAARSDPETRILACRDRLGVARAAGGGGVDDCWEGAGGGRGEGEWDWGRESRGDCGAWVLSLLVRLETVEARRLGLERHVCEVAAVLFPPHLGSGSQACVLAGA